MTKLPAWRYCVYTVERVSHKRLSNLATSVLLPEDIKTVSLAPPGRPNRGTDSINAVICGFWAMRWGNPVRMSCTAMR